MTAHYARFRPVLIVFFVVLGLTNFCALHANGLNLSYGTHPLQKLDIYTPSQRKSLVPVIIYVHGGAWSSGDKKNDAFKASGFAGQGYVYMSMNYRLSPADKYPAQVNDLVSALSWVRENIEDYGGDCHRLVFIGHGAGGHLASLIATDSKYLTNLGMKIKDIRGVVTLETNAYALSNQVPNDQDLTSEAVLATFGDDPQLWRAASPLSYIGNGGKYPPFLVIHAAKNPESVECEKHFVIALKDAGSEAFYFEALGKTSASLNTELGSPGDIPTQKILAFVRQFCR